MQIAVQPHHSDGVLRVYHCGPTVYASPHIGNLRRFLVADLLVRTAQFLGYNVRSVMNITDVGHLLDADHAAAGTDRMLLASEREHMRPEEIAAKYTQEFFDALTSLHAEPAQFFPRATLHISQMITFIEHLLQNGTAYETSSGVYFDMTKAKDYGKLSGNTLDALSVGARVDVREEKRHPADFALWITAAKDHAMQWDSPWGRGYPGWHIECSVMAMQLLGDTLDIHTGGEDNMFPHHENEIAQSEAATGKPFAHVWLHNAHLLVEEKKMSKSAGTVVTLSDMINRGYDPLAFRLLVLQTHYRSKLNFTWSALDAAQEGLHSLQAFYVGVQRNMQNGKGNDVEMPDIDLSQYAAAFRDALSDDLGSPQALASLFSLVRTVNPLVTTDMLSPFFATHLFELLQSFESVLALASTKTHEETPLPPDIHALLVKREDARAAKDFVTADILRRELWEKGYDVLDTPSESRLTPRAKT